MQTDEPSSADCRAQATHLVVFQHGLWGNAKDFRNFQALFQQYFPQDEIYAHIATSNATSLSSIFQTYDGIDTGGTRLADEVEALAREMPRLAKFSIMGHSLGGLYARFCVAVLYARGFFENVEPMNFVTLATPHMGIRRSQKTPLNAVFNGVMPSLFDLTGQQFTLHDTASKQTLALSKSVRKYPHRRPNIVYPELDGMLLVQLPHGDAVVAHPATTTPAEARTFELVECILREGILRLYQQKPLSEEENSDAAVNGDTPTASDSSGETGPEADATTAGEKEEGEEEGEALPRDTRMLSSQSSVEVVCLAEIDLLHAEVTVVLPEHNLRGRRRRHSKRSASEASLEEDSLYWDIEIAVQEVASAEESICETTPGTFTIRIPRGELDTQMKWVAALSNASHGVHCRLQSSPATASNKSKEPAKPTVLSCMTRGQFIQALQLFRVRSLYSSVFNDLQVPYSCGAIRSFNPYRSDADDLNHTRSPHYLHIVLRSLWNAPLLRDTLPEEIKHREERASTLDRFSLVKMLAERSESSKTMTRQQSFSAFFTNLTMTQSGSGRTRPMRTLSETPRLPPSGSSSCASAHSSSSLPSTTSNRFIHQRLDAIPHAAPNSVSVDIGAVDATHSESSRSSVISGSFLSVKESKRTPPFEEGALLLDHADLAFTNDELRDSLRGMLVSLQSIGWRRIDVLFHSPLAHMKIIAMQANPTKPLTKGLDIVHHVMDTFLL